MEDDAIKVLYPTVCPHCKKPLLAEILSTAPSIKALLTEEDIKHVKEKAIIRIKILHIPDEKKDEAVAWVNSGETMFTDSDIDTIINNLTKDDKASKPQNP